MTGTVSRLIARSARPAAAQTVSDAVVDLLRGLGVRSVFGIVGGGIAPFADVLGRACASSAGSSAPRFFAMRHEGGAAFAATEASLAGKRPTAVVTTTGPGLTNALTGLVAARCEGAHVLVISACASPRQRGRYAVQEMSDSALVSACPMPDAFDFSATIEHADDLASAAAAIAHGMQRPQGFVAHLALSLAAQRAPFEVPLGLPRLKLARAEPTLDEAVLADVERALAEPFAIWAGFGARHACAELRAFAEKTGAPVMLTPRGKGAFPEDHPLFLGVTGIGGHDVDARLRPLDVQRTLVLGSRLGEFTSTWSPALVPPQGFVHVDVDERVFRAAYPDAPTLGVVADVRAFLDALAPRIEAPSGTHRPPAPGARWGTFAAPTCAPVRPQVLMQVLQRLVVDEAGAPDSTSTTSGAPLVFAEPGNSFAWANHLLRFARPDYRLSGYWASMGHMVTGAVGAALETGRQCVVITGDGSMLMQSELSTAVQYRAPVVWIVLNDGRYGMTEDGMSAQGFTPLETRFPRVDFVQMARAVGADGVEVTEESALLEAVAHALDARGPFVVDVDIDVRERAPFLARVKALAAMGAPVVMNASLTSLAVALPERVIDNSFFRERFPDVVRTAEERVLGKLWSPSKDSKSARFDAAMSQYLADPFRGCVERRWLKDGEKALDLEVRAAREALALAGLDAGDVDAIICSSFFPDQLDVGNASFLAQRLGITCPAWNLESACSSSLVALETASALVHGGAHRRVLCVTSCTYSRISPPEDTLSWGNGDGAAAFLVEAVAEPLGMLGFHSLSTNVTCGAITSVMVDDRLQMQTTPEAGRLLRETAEPFLRTCVDGALAKAGVQMGDIDLFVCNTPTAWYTAFCGDVLGIPAEKTVDVHARVANVGPVLMPANLAHAARQGRVRERTLALLYAVGSVSNATAAVVRLPRVRVSPVE